MKKVFHVMRERGRGRQRERERQIESAKKGRGREVKRNSIMLRVNEFGCGFKERRKVSFFFSSFFLFSFLPLSSSLEFCSDLSTGKKVYEYFFHPHICSSFQMSRKERERKRRKRDGEMKEKKKRWRNDADEGRERSLNME